VSAHDARCPKCGKFVPADADGFYDWDTKGSDEFSGAYVVAFCNKQCADKFHGRKPLRPTDAVGIAEGFIEAESEEQIVEAWQLLHDSGLAYRLQGWFGRRAQDLLAAGVIS
jgi:hypothetical protein